MEDVPSQSKTGDKSPENPHGRASDDSSASTGNVVRFQFRRAPRTVTPTSPEPTSPDDDDPGPSAA